MRLLVCGGRDYRDRDVVNSWLSAVHECAKLVVVIHGGARGADTLANDWAFVNRVRTDVFQANWIVYGRGAGPIRNRRMLDEGKPTAVLGFPGGAGTKGMLKLARQAKLPVLDVGELTPKLPVSTVALLSWLMEHKEYEQSVQR